MNPFISKINLETFNMFNYNKLHLSRLGRIAFIVACCYASMAQADATLVYETSDTAGAKTQHTFSISGRFVRIDTEPSERPGYSLFDSGRMVMFYVDEKSHSYTPVRATPPWVEDSPAKKVASSGTAKDSTTDETASSDLATATGEAEKTVEPAPATTLKATKKKRTVAGKRCRVVIEMAGEKPVAEHCMSGTGELGLSTREMMTLSRLFTKTEKLDLKLLGVATKDESYVSIQSERAADKASQILTSAARAGIPAEKLRIPRDYKQLKPTASKAP